jgi:hypothetical protein
MPRVDRLGGATRAPALLPGTNVNGPLGSASSSSVVARSAKSYRAIIVTVTLCTGVCPRFVTVKHGIITLPSVVW